MQTNQKRNPLPSMQCQYKTDCYRRNPQHFEAYSHPHIESIVRKGRGDSGDFQIPRELDLSKDVVKIQCEIVEKLFPHLVSLQPAKRQALDDSQASSSTASPRPANTKQSKISFSPAERPRPESPKTPQREVTVIEESPERVSPLNPNAAVFTPKASTSNGNPSILQNPSGSRLEAKKEMERQVKREAARNVHDYFSVVAPKGQMAKKLADAAPYNFFLTSITDSKTTHTEPLTVTLMELLDESLGELENSVHMNFMVDISWLMANYYFAGQDEKPMLILYGDETPDLAEISKKRPNVTAMKVNMGGNPFSIHHTKVSIFCYKDGSSRIVVSTANLYVDDWHNRTQGLWVSPTLPALPEDSDTAAGESPTNFRDDFVRYLVSYQNGRLQPWITRLRKTDFSAVNVVFVASVSGGHRDIPNRGPPWGHPRVGYLLGKHAAPIDDSAPIIAQSSSIGSLGPNVNAWIGAEWTNSFRRDSAPLGIRRMPQFKMIYPSYSNVKNSHDGMLGGGCLPYRRNNNEKQPWLKSHLHQWRAKTRNRNQAMPHIKTYCRWTDRGLYWFLLTSANLSKAAWGVYNKSAKLDPPLRINNNEAGVLFLPKFVIGKNFFPMGEDKDGVKAFPMPYDVPLTPYAPEDVPFVMEHLEHHMNAMMSAK